MCPKGHKDLARAARSVPAGHALGISLHLWYNITHEIFSY